MEKKRDKKPMVRGEIGASRFPLAAGWRIRAEEGDYPVSRG